VGAIAEMVKAGFVRHIGLLAVPMDAAAESVTLVPRWRTWTREMSTLYH
jgi:hypothetical protein